MFFLRLSFSQKHMQWSTVSLSGVQPPPARAAAATADRGSRERHMASDAAASEHAVQQLQLSRSSLGKWAIKNDWPPNFGGNLPSGYD